MNADNDVPASIPEEQVNLIVEVFRMLAGPTRIRMLWALTSGELAVNELAEQLGKPAPENDHVSQLVVDAVYNAEHAGPEVPRHHRSDETVRGIASDRRPRTATQR